MTSTKRRLSILELLILVGAAAVGLSLTRLLPNYLEVDTPMHVNHTIMMNPGGGGSQSGWSFHMTGPSFSASGTPLNQRPSYWLGHVPYWAGPCLISLTFVAMILGLRRPRPRFHHLRRSPGFVAGMAMILALGVEVLLWIKFLATTGKPFPAYILLTHQIPSLLYHAPTACRLHSRCRLVDSGPERPVVSRGLRRWGLRRDPRLGLDRHGLVERGWQLVLSFELLIHASSPR